MDERVSVKLVFLANVSEEEAAVLISMLEASGIYVERRYSAVASPSVIYSGSSVLGMDLYVPEESLAQARDIIAVFPPEVPLDELEAQALAAAPPEDTDFDWYAAGYGFDKGDRVASELTGIETEEAAAVKDEWPMDRMGCDGVTDENDAKNRRGGA